MAEPTSQQDDAERPLPAEGSFAKASPEGSFIKASPEGSFIKASNRRLSDDNLKLPADQLPAAKRMEGEDYESFNKRCVLAVKHARCLASGPHLLVLAGGASRRGSTTDSQSSRTSSDVCRTRRRHRPTVAQSTPHPPARKPAAVAGRSRVPQGRGVPVPPTSRV